MQLRCARLSIGYCYLSTYTISGSVAIVQSCQLPDQKPLKAPFTSPFLETYKGGSHTALQKQYSHPPASHRLPGVSVWVFAMHLQAHPVSKAPA